MALVYFAVRLLTASLVATAIVGSATPFAGMSLLLAKEPDAAQFSAAEREHWAFQPLRKVEVPDSAAAPAADHPVDRFVQARLAAAGLSLAPAADRDVLVRRVYFDLLGLPPSPAQIDEFLNDRQPDAYARLLDRLLASPHFGERWGRHWLDEAAYVDVRSTDNDAATIHLSEHKWRYRDYVIRSVNEDKPLKQFLLEQLAGDELVDWRDTDEWSDDVVEHLTATGFLRVSPDDTFADELNTPVTRYSVLHRTGEMLIGNLLALTFSCAKCHDHKYEPISQRDYYRVMAVLQPAFNPDHWVQPEERLVADVPAAHKARMEAHNAHVEQCVAELREQLVQLRKPYELQIVEDRLLLVRAQLRATAREALATPADQRTPVQQYLVEKLQPQLKFTAADVTERLSAEDRARAEAIEREIVSLEQSKGSWQYLVAVYDVAPPTTTHVLRRGDFLTPGAVVEPGPLSVLSSAEQTARPFFDGQAIDSSGRRLAFAKWLTEPGTPAAALVLRVRVNRVWQRLFGVGLVETTDNFGMSGAWPSHPELLEYLANRFQQLDGRLKPLLREILLSDTYRQASMVDDARRMHALQVDPDNRLLWRMRLRRLQSEAVRDAMLTASGVMDPGAGGPPVFVEPRADGTFVAERAQGDTLHWRRTIYLLARRNYHPALLSSFDQPNVTAPCTQRSTSTVVLQSLTMLNDDFVIEQAGLIAERIRREAVAGDPQAQVELAFRLILSRRPNLDEQQWSVALLAQQRQALAAIRASQAELGLASSPDTPLPFGDELAQLCHMLLNTSEFLYVP